MSGRSALVNVARVKLEAQSGLVVQIEQIAPGSSVMICN